MPKRFGIFVDNIPCGRTMPLLRTKKRRLDAGHRNTSTNSKNSVPRRPNLNRIIRSTTNDRSVRHRRVVSGGACATKPELTKRFATGKGEEWRHDPARFSWLLPHHAAHCLFYFDRLRWVLNRPSPSVRSRFRLQSRWILIAELRRSGRAF